MQGEEREMPALGCGSGFGIVSASVGKIYHHNQILQNNVNKIDLLTGCT